jgi:aminoglycoside 2'-N-acetyltransferase I
MTRVVHTADLAAAERHAIRALLDAAFDGRFDDHDWDHALGGLHVVVADGARVVAHGSVVRRQLLYGDRPVRAGYVEAVAVDGQRRGRGLGRAVMDEIERIILAAYDLGALSSSEAAVGFYLARGWLPWQGSTAVLAPEGVVPTPDDDDSTYVLPVPSLSLDRTRTLVCDWRAGDVW